MNGLLSSFVQNWGGLVLRKFEKYCRNLTYLNFTVHWWKAAKGENFLLHQQHFFLIIITAMYYFFCELPSMKILFPPFPLLHPHEDIAKRLSLCFLRRSWNGFAIINHDKVLQFFLFLLSRCSGWKGFFVQFPPFPTPVCTAFPIFIISCIIFREIKQWV